jgi:glutathione S-transferase
VLAHGNLEIFDSTQIFEYLEDPQPAPAPRDLADRARARRLEHQSDEVYFPHIIRLMGLQKNLGDALALASIAAATDYSAAMEKQLNKAAVLPVVSAMANWLRAAARPVPAFMSLAEGGQLSRQILVT